MKKIYIKVPLSLLFSLTFYQKDLLVCTSLGIFWSIFKRLLSKAGSWPLHWYNNRTSRIDFYFNSRCLEISNPSSVYMKPLLCFSSKLLILRSVRMPQNLYCPYYIPAQYMYSCKHSYHTINRCKVSTSKAGVKDLVGCHSCAVDLN